MKRVTPCLYADFGHAVNLRVLPGNIDCLKPVFRRILYSLNNISKNKFVKSAYAVGSALVYHPHGDSSVYNAINTLVWQDLVLGKGSWGSYSMDGIDPPSAMRYTECRINPKISDLAFKYIKYTDYEEIEIEKEPLYIPSPIPIGLIGYDTITGIGIHTAEIPRYTIQDLTKRMIYLIKNIDNYQKIKENYLNDNIDNVDLGPKIIPNFRNCKSKNINNNATDGFYDLLFKGKAKLKIIPNFKIDHNKHQIHIMGRVPNSSFNKLKTAISNNVIPSILRVVDLCGKSNKDNINVILEIKKNNGDINELFKVIWKNYIIGNINFVCNFINEDKKPELLSIDDVLINNYSYYLLCVKRYYYEEFNKLINKMFSLEVIKIIKNIIENKSINDINELLEIYKDDKIIKLEKIENDEIVEYKRVILKDDLKEISNKYSINNLLNIKINLNELKDEIDLCKENIKNIDNICYADVERLKDF